MEFCLLQVEPLGITDFMPRCCWDLRTEREIQLFQLCPLAQGFKQICGALCSFRVSAEAPAVFCEKMSETICQKHLETAISAGIQSILNTYRSIWTHTTTSQIYTHLNSDNIQQRHINTRRKQENLQPFLSARHRVKSAFFKLSHLALRTLCHAAAGI